MTLEIFSKETKFGVHFEPLEPVEFEGMQRGCFTCLLKPFSNVGGFYNAVWTDFHFLLEVDAWWTSSSRFPG
jgi:hypothetical protein